MSKGIVLSLYDYTGYAVKPWAKAGFDCYCFDIGHKIANHNNWEYYGIGKICYKHVDLHDINNLGKIADLFRIRRVKFIMGFPVCTDLAVSGAAHFEKKSYDKHPLFQYEAAEHAMRIEQLAKFLNAPYMIENPVSRLSTLWRKPDYSFNPYEYGGYLTDNNAEHPDFPEYIKPYDAYPKKTCLWTGNGFVMPDKKEVPWEDQHYSLQHLKLGGKSDKTKMIRSATPRGFAQAVYEVNS